MNEYYSNETVIAMQVNWLEGSKCSETKGKKDGTISKSAEIVDLGNTFVSQHNIRVGDYVIFRHGKADQVVNANTFETDYSPMEQPVDPAPLPE